MNDFSLGSVEMLEKNYIIPLLGAFRFTCAPGAWASPRIAITSHKVNQIVEWGHGDTPLGLHPPLGERGGHLRIFFKSTKR